MTSDDRWEMRGGEAQWRAGLLGNERVARLLRKSVELRVEFIKAIYALDGLEKGRKGKNLSG